MVLTGQATPAEAWPRPARADPAVTTEGAATVGFEHADRRVDRGRHLRPPAAGPRKGGRRREEIVQDLFVVPALAIVALFGYPVVKNLTMSFQEYTLRTFFTGEAPWVGLDNYATVVTVDVFATRC